MSLPAAVALAGALLLAAVACGEETFESSPEAREQATAALETWLGACANEDGEAVLEVLSPPTRELVLSAPSVLDGCERVADLTRAQAPGTEELKTLFEEAHVEGVEVDAGFGTAVVRAPGGRISEVELELEKGRWALTNPPLAAS